MRVGRGPGAHRTRAKLQGAHFGGIRQPMAVSWPKSIKPDTTPRAQFHHVNDMVPTVYEILGITPPRVVNGFEQDSFDGVSVAYTFADATAKGQKTTQFATRSRAWCSRRTETGLR